MLGSRTRHSNILTEMEELQKKQVQLVMEESQKKQVQARLTMIPVAEGSHLQNGAARDDKTESGKDGKVVASIDPEQLGG